MSTIDTRITYVAYADTHQQIFEALAKRLRSQIADIKRKRFLKKRDTEIAQHEVRVLERELEFITALEVKPLADRPAA